MMTPKIAEVVKSAAQINCGVNAVKDQNKKDGERDQRKDVANERRRFITTSEAEQKIKDKDAQDADAQERE